MKSDSIIKNYSIALFEAALNNKSQEQTLEDLSKVLDSINLNYSFKRFMLSSACPYKMKSVFVQTILQSLKIGDLVSRFIEILLKNNRMTYIQKIRDKFESLMYERHGIRRVILRTVSQPSKSSVDLIKSGMESILKTEVQVESIVDPKILGGVILRVDSKVLDCSLASKLNKIRNLARVGQ